MKGNFFGDAISVAAMEKVLDVYRRPYNAAFPVVCMDETPRPLLRETRVPVPGRCGRPARHDYEYQRGEYQRGGTCNVFMATVARTIEVPHCAGGP